MNYTIIHDNFTNEDFDFVPSDLLEGGKEFWDYVVVPTERATHSFTTRETDKMYAVYLSEREGRYFDEETAAHDFADKIGAVVQPFATDEDLAALEQN